MMYGYIPRCCRLGNPDYQNQIVKLVVAPPDGVSVRCGALLTTDRSWPLWIAVHNGHKRPVSVKAYYLLG